MPLLIEQEPILLNGAYKIVIAGHSLGAAAASLLAIILRSRMPSLVLHDNLQVYSFASPPVLDHDAALACTSFTTTIVNNSDIVPRSSMANLRSFIQFLQVFHQKLEGEGMGLGSPKAAIKLIRKLLRGTDGDLLMTQEEVTEAMARKTFSAM
jgi:pimeloyl-ACP methyl ester carboxylesterase